MKIAVILSGCGVFDGTEIHESTMLLLAIAKNGAEYRIFAPDLKQHHVINHINGEEMDESRNVLVESARIARGKIESLDKYNPSDFDALLFPGGFGVAKNLSSYAFDGPACSVDKSIEKIIKETHSKKIPIGALCISPVLITRVLGEIDVTIGSDETTAGHIEEMGGIHIATKNGEVVVDNNNLIVTNPCYMLDASITDIADGTDNLIKAVIGLIKQKQV